MAKGEQGGAGTDTGAGGMADLARLPAMQRMAAEHLHRSHVETAPVSLFVQADAEALAAFRDRLNVRLGRSGARAVSYTHILIKAVARTLAGHPLLNAGLDGETVHRYREINIGMALALSDGNLVVPVVRTADRRGIGDIADEATALAAKGAAGRLALADVRGATFTLSNAGMVPSARWSTPIIVRGQGAILGVGAIHRAPVVHDGAISARLVMPLSLTFDHRLVNGLPASLFLDDLIGLLAAPDRLGEDD